MSRDTEDKAMQFYLQIDCDNAAFEETPASEIARILRDAAKRVEDDADGLDERAPLYDANGNKVGWFIASEA